MLVARAPLYPAILAGPPGREPRVLWERAGAQCNFAARLLQEAVYQIGQRVAGGTYGQLRAVPVYFNRGAATRSSPPAPVCGGRSRGWLRQPNHVKDSIPDLSRTAQAEICGIAYQVQEPKS